MQLLAHTAQSPGWLLGNLNNLHCKVVEKGGGESASKTNRGKSPTIYILYIYFCRVLLWKSSAHSGKMRAPSSQHIFMCVYVCIRASNLEEKQKLSEIVQHCFSFSLSLSLASPNVNLDNSQVVFILYSRCASLRSLFPPFLHAQAVFSATTTTGILICMKMEISLMLSLL